MSDTKIKMRFKVDLRYYRSPDFALQGYMITVFDPISRKLIRGVLNDENGLYGYKGMIDLLEKELLKSLHTGEHSSRVY